MELSTNTLDGTFSTPEQILLQNSPPKKVKIITQINVVEKNICL